MRTDLILDRGVRAKDSRIVASTWQDVEPVLEANHALRGQAQPSDWGRHIGSIPNVILVRWLNEEYMRGNTQLRMFSPDFDRLIARKLRDPEWKYLRTDK